MRQRIAEVLRLHGREDSVLDRRPLDLGNSFATDTLTADGGLLKEEFASEIEAALDALTPRLQEPPLVFNKFDSLAANM